MEIRLHETEVRVLGALVEKELTIPEYYPLTLNSLTAACNQKSNRDPVMTLSDRDVESAIENLRSNQLMWRRNIAGSRVPKYEHNVYALWHLDQQQTAVLCVLMLRGAQTVGEIRGRTGRMYEFRDLDEVDATVANLMNHEKGPFVVELPRQPGRKENRFMHLLAGEPSVETVTDDREPAPIMVNTGNDRIAALEEQVAQIQGEVNELRQQFVAFKKAFE